MSPESAEHLGYKNICAKSWVLELILSATENSSCFDGSLACNNSRFIVQKNSHYFCKHFTILVGVNGMYRKEVNEGVTDVIS